MPTPKRALKSAVPVFVGVAFAALTAFLIRKRREARSVGVRLPQGEKGPQRFSAQKVLMAFDAASAIPLWATAPLVRRWHLRWGATDVEVTSEMPGDSIVPRAQFNATRAITINVPPEQVWPWITQLGYGRAGFYTYDLVDNAGIPSADRIVEEYQQLAIGDLIPMFHELRGLAIAYKVDSFQKDEWMIWVHRPHEDQAPDSTWTWRLDHVPNGSTRLVTRMKQDYRWETPGLALFNVVLMELGDFAMERRMLKGIKERAERSLTSRAPAPESALSLKGSVQQRI